MRSLILSLYLLIFIPALSAEALEPVPEVIRSKVPPPEIEAASWLLVDFETGWILGQKNANQKLEPASLTKLMTSYLVFDALTKGEISLADKVYISKKAWQTGGSKMFIQVNTHVSVEELLKGLIIQSGNDASVALAEHLGGSEEGFAVKMNLMAAELGMTGTHFTNSNGLPDESHYSTALDMVLLAQSLIREFPEYYTYYSQREYTYNDITQQNRNVLLSRDPTVDGIKTGYTQRAGYGLIGSANRSGVRLIAIVTGASSKKIRADLVQSLLQYGYAAYDGMVLYESLSEVKKLPLWMGEMPTASVGVNQTLGILYPKGKSDQLSAALDLPESLEAPLASGRHVGFIQVKFNGQPILKKTLHVNQDYPEGPWLSRMMDSIKRLIF